MERKKKYTIYITPQLHEQLQRYADSKYCSLSQVIAAAIKEYLENHAQF